MRKTSAGLSALISCSIFWLSLSSFSDQTEFPELRGKYFGQKEPGEKAEIFAPGIISVTGRYDLALNFSPDGYELIFSAQGPEGSMCIFHSRQVSGRWTEPKPVSLSRGKKKEEMEAFFSPDGTAIYFAAYDEGMDVRIWIVDRSADRSWSNPRQLGPPISDDPAFYPTCTRDNTIYYTNIAKRRVDRASLSEGEILSCEDSGIPLGGHPFVAPDESFVLVDSTASENPDSRDIYVTFRKKDGTWSSPINLGPEVNTEYFETCPSMTSDGKYIFFSRYNEPNEIADIYWISSSILQPLRKQASGLHEGQPDLKAGLGSEFLP
jgi:Tol biopolymer transport system component